MDAPNVQITKGPLKDLVGHLRVSNSDTALINLNVQGHKHHHWFKQTEVGGSIVDVVNDSSVELQVSDVATAKTVMQSARVISYIPSKPTVAVITGRFGDSRVGTVQEMGIGDKDNGITLRNTEGDLSIVLYTDRAVIGTAEETIFPVAEWGNKFIKDDAQTTSPPADFTKGLLLRFSYLWQGFGGFLVELNIDGEWYTMIEKYFSAKDDFPFIRNPHLPIRYAIWNTAATAAGTVALSNTCSTGIREGGTDNIGDTHTFDGTVLAGDERLITCDNLVNVRLMVIRPMASQGGAFNRKVLHLLAGQLYAIVNDAKIIIAHVHDCIFSGTQNVQGVDPLVSFAPLEEDSAFEYTYAAAAAGGVELTGTEHAALIGIASAGKTSDSIIQSLETDGNHRYINNGIDETKGTQAFVVYARALSPGGASAQVAPVIEWEELG